MGVIPLLHEAKRPVMGAAWLFYNPGGGGAKGLIGWRRLMCASEQCGTGIEVARFAKRAKYLVDRQAES
jgi:hypothetical protein